MLLIDCIALSMQRNGGISVYFQQLLKYLASEREPTTCFIEEPAKQAVEASADSLNVERRQARRLERFRTCRVPTGGDVFHTSYYRQPSRRNVPTVVTVYDFLYERYLRGPRLWAHREQKTRAIRSAQSVICISEATRDDLLEFVGETPGQTIHVIHCGVSDEFHQLPLDAPVTQYVLFVGPRRAYKNFVQVLLAMMFLPDLELHCVGGGALRREELHGVPESVARRVRHLGPVGTAELNELYGRALCLAYPSHYEGFGIPVIEAMQAGCPVVSTECKAVLEVGKDALTVVSGSDPRAMADAIMSTASSARENLKLRGLAVAQGYSWKAMHRKTLQVYRSLGA